jgi:hypothetical protein
MDSAMNDFFSQNRLLTALLTLLMMLSGCAVNIKEQKQQIALEQTLSAYQTQLRWGEPIALTRFIDPDQQDVINHAIQELSQHRIVGYEVIEAPRITTPDQATQLVKIQYINTETQRLYTIIDHQNWHYDAQRQTWHLTSQPLCQTCSFLPKQQQS